MTVEGKIQTLADGLNGKSIDLDLLLHDIHEKTTSIELEATRANFSRNSPELIQWGADTYNAKTEYQLMSTAGIFIGTVSLVKPLPSLGQEGDYTDAFEAMQKLTGQELDEQSKMVLDACQDYFSPSRLYIIESQIERRDGAAVNIMEAYLEAHGFTKGEYTLTTKEHDFTVDIEGTLPDTIRKFGRIWYRVEFDNMQYKHQEPHAIVGIQGSSGGAYISTDIGLFFPGDQKAIRDLDRAAKSLETLSQYILLPKP